MNICQSCGMQMKNKDLHGKNRDESLSIVYCKYCYPNGEYNNPKETFEEKVESCIPFEMKEGFTEDEARGRLVRSLKTLKRWL